MTDESGEHYYLEHGGGVFSRAEREFLLHGSEGLSKNQIRSRRYNIRRKIQASLVDFEQLLWLGEPDLIRAFAPLAAWEGHSGVNHDVVNSETLDDIADVDFDDETLGRHMGSGLQNFFAVLAAVLGPERLISYLSAGLELGDFLVSDPDVAPRKATVTVDFEERDAF